MKAGDKRRRKRGLKVRQEVSTKLYFKPEFREMRCSCVRLGSALGTAGRRGSLCYTVLSAFVFHIFRDTESKRRGSKALS